MLKLKFKKVGLFVFFGLSILNFKVFATNKDNEKNVSLSYKEVFEKNEEEKKDLQNKEKEEKEEKVKDESKNEETKAEEVKSKLCLNSLQTNNEDGATLEEEKQQNKENKNLKIFETEKKTIKEQNKEFLKTNPLNGKVKISSKNLVKKTKNEDEKEEKKFSEMKEKEINFLNQKQECNEIETTKKIDIKKVPAKTQKSKELKDKKIGEQKTEVFVKKDRWLEELEHISSALKKNELEFEKILNLIKKTQDPRISDLILFDENFKLREFYGTNLNLIKKECNFADLKTTVDKGKDLKNEIFKKLKVLYDKNKDKIFFNPSNVGFSVTDLIRNFNLEFKNILHNSVRFDKDFLLRDNFVCAFKVPGYKTKKMVTKFTNRYYVYEEEESKARVVLAVPGWDFKHIIILKNPNEKTLKKAEELKNVEKYIEKDEIRIVNDSINEDFIKKIYPCVKNQYYDDRDNLLVLIKDATKGYFKNRLNGNDELQFENEKYTTILKILKEHLFSRIYNDYDFDLKYVDEKKEEQENEQKKVLNSFEYFKEENKDFFEKDEEVYKYCSEVEFKLPKHFKAKSKDILDFDRDGLKNFLKDELENCGYFNFDVNFDILKDSLKLKFFGNDDKSFKQEEFSENLDKIKTKLISEFCYDFDKNEPLTGFLLKCNSLNRPLKMYENIRTNEKKFERFFYDNRSLDRLRIDFINEFPRSFNEGFEKNFATAVIDWSKEYRAKTPMWDLIIKSFKDNEKGELFSDEVFDIENDTINDYVLRIYENLKNASFDLANLFFEGESRVKIYENLNYR